MYLFKVKRYDEIWYIKFGINVQYSYHLDRKWHRYRRRRRLCCAVTSLHYNWKHESTGSSHVLRQSLWSATGTSRD